VSQSGFESLAAHTGAGNANSAKLASSNLAVCGFESRPAYLMGNGAIWQRAWF
jgi:hypothetical protein